MGDIAGLILSRNNTIKQFPLPVNLLDHQTDLILTYHWSSLSLMSVPPSIIQTPLVFTLLDERITRHYPDTPLVFTLVDEHSARHHPDTPLVFLLVGTCSLLKLPYCALSHSCSSIWCDEYSWILSSSLRAIRSLFSDGQSCFIHMTN